MSGIGKIVGTHEALAWRALAVGGLACGSLLSFGRCCNDNSSQVNDRVNDKDKDKDNNNDKNNNNNNNGKKCDAIISQGTFVHVCGSKETRKSLWFLECKKWIENGFMVHNDHVRNGMPSFVLMSSTGRTWMEAKDDNIKSTSLSAPQSFDFVVIGNGKAGQSAVRELFKQCPEGTIAVIDPLRANDTSSSKRCQNVTYFSNLAASIDPKTRSVQLMRTTATAATATATEEQNTLPPPPELQYKYAALIATGATGAPPPSYLIDKQAWTRILELRPTMFPQLQRQTVSANNNDNDIDNSDPQTTNRPLERHHYTTPNNINDERKFLLPTESRDLVIRAAQQEGKAVGVLGRGWDALDLAIACSTPDRRRKTNHRPTLLYGGTGPLSHVLPQYLVAAVTKRLKSRKILLHDRALVRYVSFDDRTQRMAVYTAKAYDVLDSQRIFLDWLLVAPEVSGSRGNALLPTSHIPPHLQDSSGGRCWYDNWSHLSIRPFREQDNHTVTTTSASASSLVPMLLCYNDDGRIAVNSELMACTGVYAAGSVAKCGNAFSGDAQVTGGGVVNATAAGQAAASNMARHYIEPALCLGKDGVGPVMMPICVKDPLPIWRSDVLSYDPDTASSLSSAGITALCVGTCDSERLTTHGVFWTNQSAQVRFMQEFSNLPEGELQRRAKEQMTKSVYGIGVVYYLDASGRIQGIMTWGLPIATVKDMKLNDELVQQIKDILMSPENTGWIPGASETLAFFAENSKQLVRTAFSDLGDAVKARQNHGLDLKDFPKPLHQYTPIWMTNLAFRKRKHQAIQGHSNGSTGVLGEDLFAPSMHNRFPVQLPQRPVSGVGFSDPSSETFQASLNMYEYQVWEKKEKRWAENEASACPPKEDICWVRKGHEDRTINAMDQYNEALAMVLLRRYSVPSHKQAHHAAAAEGLNSDK